MTNYPKLQPKKIVREVTDTFRGYNHNLRIKDGEFYDLCNLTSDEFPLLSTRAGEVIIGRRNNISFLDGYGETRNTSSFKCVDVIYKNPHFYYLYRPINGIVSLYEDNTFVASFIGSTDNARLLSFGAYILISGVNAYYNTKDAEDNGLIKDSITFTYTSESVDDHFRSYLCNANKEPIAANDIKKQKAKPATSISQHYWIETDDNGKGIALYRKENSAWVLDQKDNAFQKIFFDVYRRYKTGDYIFIDKENTTLTDAVVPFNTPNFFRIEEEKTIQEDAVEEPYIIISGNIYETIDAAMDMKLTFSNEIPDMDFMCVASNRVWGCKYGRGFVYKYNEKTKSLDRKEENINELYCSALGDFKNWHKYDGISTDSWTASVGSDGEWTGCIAYNSDPIFFKEDKAHRISVSSVGAHRVSEYSCEGVQKGSDKSLTIIENVIFYKSANGIALFEGGMTQTIQKPFGKIKYKKATAASQGNKYYISVLNDNDEENVFVYDTERKTIVKELFPEYFGIAHNAESRIIKFVNDKNGDIYSMCAIPKVGLVDGMVFVKHGGGTEKVKWFCESGILGYEYPDRKYVTRYLIRAKLEAGAAVNIFIEYDSSGTWEPAGRIQVETTNSFLLPVRPHRCDHLRIRLEGDGDVKIFSIARELCKGSDRP